SDYSGGPIKIVPRGPSSFDEHDADFFLELLPGPRDRDGLPEALRFWKRLIEATDSDQTFRVGFIYGPSGCGKSSLVKAGLLPRLSKTVSKVYIEATAAETESRLLRGVRKAFPKLSSADSLLEALTALRRGRPLRGKGKVLLVLDQFEQWLSGRAARSASDLVDALRQCDGERVQALCLVRGEFSMAMHGFMRELEIDLDEKVNLAFVDLFDAKHARKVLAAYGHAYECLPPGGADLAPEQDAFLRQAVAGLAGEGGVVPVRLAIFAEMVKSKPW